MRADRIGEETMRSRTGVGLLVVLLAACSNPTEPTGNLKSDVGTLKYEVQALQAEVRAMQAELRQTSLRLTNSVGEQFAPVDLSGAYGTARTSVGTNFFVSWKDSKPQGDGTLVTLNIGNPYAAVFHGGVVRIQYLAPAKGKDAIPTELVGETRDRYTEALIPGRWTPVRIRLPGVKPDQVGMLLVTLTPDVIQLKE